MHPSLGADDLKAHLDFLATARCDDFDALLNHFLAAAWPTSACQSS
jgi:hypothetical protein